MRTLNDYFLDGGSMSAIQTANNATSKVAVVPDKGELVAVVMNVHTLVDSAIVTFDVLINATDSAVDVSLPAATPDESGVVMNLPTRVDVVEGDAISIRSNGEQNTACLADVGYIVRR